MPAKTTVARFFRPADSSQYGPARIRHGLMKLSKFPRMSGQIRNTANWIGEIMLNRYEVYGEDANAFLEEACEKALTAFETLSGQQ